MSDQPVVETEVVLYTSEQGPCDCCGPDVTRTVYPNVYEAMHAAEVSEKIALDWVEVTANESYTARTTAWWRTYAVEVEPIDEDE